MIILAILLPPLAVFLATHSISKTFINFLLTCCIWIPGMIHALMTVSEAKSGKRLRQMENRLIDSQAKIAEAQAKAQQKAAEDVAKRQ